MKFTKFKKSIAMGLAAMTVISAMSMTAFASEVNNLVAEIPAENGEIVSIYESDLVDGSYTVESGELTITVAVEESEDGITPLLSNMFQAKLPSSMITIFDDGDQNTRFSVAKTVTHYSPTKYSPGTGASSLKYIFTADSKYDTGVRAYVHINGRSDDMYVQLYDTSKHSINISGLSSSTETYAYVNNSSYNGTVTGSCDITN